jgi:type IV pilus assembly protein PilA
MHRNNGFTLIELVLVVAIIATLAAIAVPSYNQVQRSANEASAIGSLRTISTVLEQYRLRTAEYPATLADVNAAGMLDALLTTGEKTGYIFKDAEGAGGTPGQFDGVTDFTWRLYAAPKVPGSSGDREFMIDQTGVLQQKLPGGAWMTVQ